MWTILLIVILLIAALLAYAATKPASFRIERAIGIDAPPEKIFPLIANFRSWTQWSPWEKVDPALKRSYAGAPSGVGAVYSWEGDRKAGAGRMEIAQATPFSKIIIKLDFQKPFEAHNIAEFDLTPDGGGTRVVWTMRGPSPYRMRLMGVFFSMDRMIGGRFEEGLASMKAAAEKPDA